MCCDDEFGSKQVGCKILMQNGEINMKYLEIQIGMHQLWEISFHIDANKYRKVEICMNIQNRGMQRKCPQSQENTMQCKGIEYSAKEKAINISQKRDGS